MFTAVATHYDVTLAQATQKYIWNIRASKANEELKAFAQDKASFTQGIKTYCVSMALDIPESMIARTRDLTADDMRRGRIVWKYIDVCAHWKSTAIVYNSQRDAAQLASDALQNMLLPPPDPNVDQRNSQQGEPDGDGGSHDDPPATTDK